MRISDWSSDVCSSDLGPVRAAGLALPVDDRGAAAVPVLQGHRQRPLGGFQRPVGLQRVGHGQAVGGVPVVAATVGRPFPGLARDALVERRDLAAAARSEEHTSELQSLMRISYAVFCLKKKKNTAIN